MTAEHTIQPTIAPTLGNGAATLLAWLREMRDHQPVWRDAYGIWHVFRYADVQRAISDTTVFSSDIGRVSPMGQNFNTGNPLRLPRAEATHQSPGGTDFVDRARGLVTA